MMSNYISGNSNSIFYLYIISIIWIIVNGDCLFLFELSADEELGI